jgi:hypothetical protein
MGVRQEATSEEIKDLKRCLNDLVSVLALPAIWSGFQPPQIVHALLDALPLRRLAQTFASAPEFVCPPASPR